MNMNKFIINCISINTLNIIILPIGSFPLTNSVGDLLKVSYIEDLQWRYQGLCW